MSFLLYIWCFQKYVQYESNDNVIKYHGSVISHDWDVSFEKFGVLPTVVAFWKTNFQGRDKLIFQSMSPNEFSEVSHTIGSKTALGTVCYKQLQSDGAISNRGDINLCLICRCGLPLLVAIWQWLFRSSLWKLHCSLWKHPNMEIYLIDWYLILMV